MQTGDLEYREMRSQTGGVGGMHTGALEHNNGGLGNMQTGGVEYVHGPCSTVGRPERTTRPDAN
jgi:hypothetical protein